MMANCSMQNVSVTLSNSVFTSPQWVCTYPPRPPLALDIIFLYIFIGIFVVGLIGMAYKYRKYRTIHKTEEATDDETDEGDEEDE